MPSWFIQRPHGKVSLVLEKYCLIPVSVFSLFLPQTFSIQSITHLHVYMFRKQILRGNKTHNKFKLFPTGINQTADRPRAGLILIWAGVMCMQATYSSVLVKIVSLFLISPILIGSAAARSLTCTVAWQRFPKHIENLKKRELFSLGIT